MPGLVAMLAAACDRQRIAELEEGVATEADVRQRFGEPAAIYAEDGRVLAAAVGPDPKDTATGGR
jgi:hypothetical protein